MSTPRSSATRRAMLRPTRMASGWFAAREARTVLNPVSNCWPPNTRVRNSRTWVRNFMPICAGSRWVMWSISAAMRWASATVPPTTLAATRCNATRLGSAFPRWRAISRCATWYSVGNQDDTSRTGAAGLRLCGRVCNWWANAGASTTARSDRLSSVSRASIMV